MWPQHSFPKTRRLLCSLLHPPVRTGRGVLQAMELRREGFAAHPAVPLASCTRLGLAACTHRAKRARLLPGWSGEPCSTSQLAAEAAPPSPRSARERPEAAGAVPSRHLHGSLPAWVTLGLAAPAASLPAALLPALQGRAPFLAASARWRRRPTDGSPRVLPRCNGRVCVPAPAAGLAMGSCLLLIAAHLPRECNSLAALAASHPRVGLAGRGQPCWRAREPRACKQSCERGT